ncbi:DNA mismatch repair protein msh-2 [Uncinocarpus reesii 1704]|uniref:DNA mismatch repair protein MSH3 n=1 Tax=Uncinocarpus reesii (strain UAMH 1704) TaxID=336963 RepID=C4JWD3_UNCRE|nr:DNA mismatch repair protein msh-2 [Uncinocarpus reesii 1704]EEP82010.1 DNA mismatch repair protein msh-2 [Uncinocarpus reesii 1704]
MATRTLRSRTPKQAGSHLPPAKTKQAGIQGFTRAGKANAGVGSIASKETPSTLKRKLQHTDVEEVTPENRPGGGLKVPKLGTAVSKLVSKPSDAIDQNLVIESHSTVDTPNCKRDESQTIVPTQTKSEVEPEQPENCNRPSSYLELVFLYSSFLHALSLHFAHNGLIAPVDLTVFLPNMERVWKKRKVTTEDIRRLLYVQNTGDGNKISVHSRLIDYGVRILLERVQANQSGNSSYAPLNEDELNAKFEDNLEQIWLEKSTAVSDFNCMRDIPLEPIYKIPKTLFSIKQQKASEIRLTGLKAPKAMGFVQEKGPLHKSCTTERRNGLLERIKSKALRQSTLTPPVSKETAMRRAAAARTSDIVNVLLRLAPSASSDLEISPSHMKKAYKLETMVQMIQDSMQNPVSKSEISMSLEILAKSEVSGGWVTMVPVASTKSVILRSSKNISPQDIKVKVDKTIWPSALTLDSTPIHVINLRVASILLRQNSASEEDGLQETNRQGFEQKMSSRPELKVDDEVGFIRFFRSLPPKDDSATVRVFDRGDWYTAHGSDAEYIARTVYKTTSVLRTLGRSDTSGLPSVTMTVTVFRNFLREALFRLSMRLEIWSSQGGAGKGAWKLAKQASPGNLQDVEDELGSAGGMMDTSPIILAVKISAKASETRHVGVCFADASVRELGVSEFDDNDLYSNFESLVIQLGVKECLVTADGQKKDIELAKIRSIADSCGIAISSRPASDFATRDIDQDLARLLKNEHATGTLPQTDLKLAMGSAAALIKYLGAMSDPSNFGQYQLYQHDLSQYMKLDSAALRALNLMPGPRDGAKSMSLYGLLNHCKTPVGGRLLAQWLKQPLMNHNDIEKRQQLVEAFVSDTDLRQTMQEDHLRSIPDLYRLAKKFQRNVANLEDVVRIYQVVIRLPGFINTLEAVMDEQYQEPLETEYTSKIRNLSNSFGKLAEMVETTVDLEALDHHEFIIKPEFDESLRTIRKKLDRLRHDMDAEHKHVGHDLNQDIEKKLFLENHRVHGWCFRLTRNEAGCIRNKREYQECSTQKNGVYFTTSTMQSLRREHDQLSQNYNRTQTGLVNEVVNVAASYCPLLEQLAGVLAHLDVIVSFAHVSVHAPTPYVRPKVHPRGTGNTILKEARHPCMEMQDDISFITNDVSLIRDESSFLIITGPNMGGKSTYIRQIGVIALMAQTGCFVPCTEAELTIFDCILARVGASDSQLKGVSTFMAEMLETANILKTATSESLIIIDELGRGTSTYDGFGLAWAISEHIVAEIRCFGLFATHFHELTALEERYPKSAKNLHVVAFIGDGSSETQNGTPSKKKREVTLLYRVEPGVCDQSFGIHVAELVRFPEKVVNMARQKAEELEDFTNSTAEKGEDSMDLDKYSCEEVAEGSSLLKAMLVKWKAQVEAPGNENMTTEEKRQLMRDLVQADDLLKVNKVFQDIKAL